MTTHPYVRQLLLFEGQRVGATIHFDGDASGPTHAITLTLPPGDAASMVHELPLPDGTRHDITLTVLPEGEFCEVPGPSGSLAVAASNADVLHLAFDPSHLAETGQRALLSHIWDLAVAPALARLAERTRDAESRDRLDAFVRLEEQVWRETTQRLPHEIDNQEYTVSRTEAQLRDQLAKLGDLRRQQRALQVALPDAVRQAAREQHEALLRLVPAMFRSIDLRGDQLVAITRPVVLEDDDGEVDVGRFEVVIALETGQIRITNMTRVTNGIHHPHVRGPQDICWGNLKAGMTRLLAEREWAGALVVVSRFLNSYAEGDAFQKLSEWDPDRAEDDDEYDSDDEDSEEEDTVDCTICLERTASDEVTHVQDTPVCLACFERDTFVCSGPCASRTLSRNQARESLRCRSCVSVAATQVPQAVAS